MPAALLHNLKHNQVLHEIVVLLTVAIAETPRVEEGQRLEIHAVGNDFTRVVLHYGFTEEIDIPRDLAPISQSGVSLDPMRTSYLLGRQKLIAAKDVAGMALWREHLFAWLLRCRNRRWTISDCQPTAWSNWAASSGSERHARVGPVRRACRSGYGLHMCRGPIGSIPASSSRSAAAMTMVRYGPDSIITRGVTGVARMTITIHPAYAEAREVQ